MVIHQNIYSVGGRVYAKGIFTGYDATGRRDTVGYGNAIKAKRYIGGIRGQSI